jgi:thiosulfate/3-mercaptopyruvate sulfurtransferase
MKFLKPVLVREEREHIHSNADPYPLGNGKVKWVSTKWLQDHLEDPNIMIVDCQPDTYDYVEKHIPGAVYLSERVLRTTIGGIPARYMPSEIIQRILQLIGLRVETSAVVYTGNGQFRVKGDGAEQAMVAYTLARFGHDRVYILDGGLEKWRGESRKLAKLFPSPTESRFNVNVDSKYFVEYDEFKLIKDKEDIVHLDTRPANLYEGDGPWVRMGHIPGAVSLPWTLLVDDKNPRLLKPEREIRLMLEKRGATPDKSIILSCGTGRHATSTFLILKWFLNYPRVRLYEGSFTEWITHAENTTVLGKNPR